MACLSLPFLLLGLLVAFLGLLVAFGLPLYVGQRMVRHGRRTPGGVGELVQAVGGAYLVFFLVDAFFQVLDPRWPGDLPPAALVGYLFASAVLEAFAGAAFFRWGWARRGQRNARLERWVGVGLMVRGLYFGVLGVWAVGSSRGFEGVLRALDGGFLWGEGVPGVVTSTLMLIVAVFLPPSVVLLLREIHDWWTESRPWR